MDCFRYIRLWKPPRFHVTTKTHRTRLLPCVCICALYSRDLRGNKFECDCKAKWLYLWLKMTNSTVSDVLCIGPPEYQEKKLNDVTSFDYECTTTGRQSLSPQRWTCRIMLSFPSGLPPAYDGKWMEMFLIEVILEKWTRAGKGAYCVNVLVPSLVTWVQSLGPMCSK